MGRAGQGNARHYQLFEYGRDMFEDECDVGNEWYNFLIISYLALVNDSLKVGSGFYMKCNRAVWQNF